MSAVGRTIRLTSSTSSRVLLFLSLYLLFALTPAPGRAADPPAHSPATAPDAAKATPKLVIVSAAFGDLDGGKTADVTAKVAAMVKDNCLSVDATTSNFGDPAGGKVKHLKVAYTIDGIYRTKTVDEGETLDISPRLFIRKAVYGVLPDGGTIDVTDAVADLVRKNHLSVEATNDQFGTDPASGVVKKLRVDYTFDGANKSKTVNENQTLAIPD